MPTIRLDDITKIYKNGKQKFKAVNNISFEITQGEFVFLVGSRGAGATTVMNIISGKIKPNSGAVYLDDYNLTRMSRRQGMKYRRCIGVVPQESELVRTETVYRNLAADKKFGRLGIPYIDDVLVKKALGLVGMSGCEERYPLEFSISECRRLELAKALIRSPQILLLDEFTDRMEDDMIWDMMHLLEEINKLGTTVVMATHAKTYVNIMRRRVITLVDGHIFGDVRKGRFGDIK